jgi:hypothetical protein
MKPLFYDLATLLVSVTLSLATVSSLFIVVFAGAA